MPILRAEQNKLQTWMITKMYLHGYRKVILCFRWKEHIDCFLGKWLIALRRLSNLDHMQLSTDTTTITHWFTSCYTDDWKWNWYRRWKFPAHNTTSLLQCSVVIQCNNWKPNWHRNTKLPQTLSQPCFNKCSTHLHYKMNDDRRHTVHYGMLRT